MQRSASTIAGYIKDFHAHRDEITETLAADQLVHSLAGINNPDPDLHQQHIQAARELRLQVDTLDRLTDRRQRRDRRVFEEQSADSIRNLEAYEELAETLIKSGLWDDPTPLDHFFQTGHFPNEPNQQPAVASSKSSPSGGAVSAATTPTALDAGSVPLPPLSTPRSTPKQPRKTLDQTHQNHPLPRSNPIKSEQTRSRSQPKASKTGQIPSRTPKIKEKPPPTGSITRPNCPSEPNLRPIDPGRRPRLR